ncbi:DnaA ATPase domain-containing protein [Paenibacillus aurantiacus]|uniref:DnaA ATPase domain-containing protein n=1 Tax=Paenibacillus aurantiacus TaxID=1936118 RepID=A0ABV5KP64_9BACL
MLRKMAGFSSLDLEELKRRAEILRSQTTNSTSSSYSSVCPKCHDTGTINVIELVDTGFTNSKGESIMREQIKTDPITGKLPLCECYKDKLFDKYNASAGMKPEERMRLFDSADIDDENASKFEIARAFVEQIEHHLAAGAWLYIFGDAARARPRGLSEVGTGKSYLTHCIGNELTRAKFKAIYVTEDKLFGDIKATYNRDSEESEGEVLSRYQDVPILLIDDLFKSKQTDWTEDKLFHLLNNRLGPNKVTIINSNYAPNRIELVCPKTGSAISSRILGAALNVEMIGKDRRRQQRRTEVPKWTSSNSMQKRFVD